MAARKARELNYAARPVQCSPAALAQDPSRRVGLSAGAPGVGYKPQLGMCRQSTASIQNNSDLTQGPAGCSAAG